MTTCIKCGRPVPDGELFCEACNLNPGDLDLDALSGKKPAPRPQTSQPQGRMKAPVKQPPKPRPASQPVRVKTKAPAGLVAALWIVSILALVASALALYQLSSTQSHRTALRLRQSQLEEQEAYYAQVEQELAQLTGQLDQAQATLQAQEAQIRQLEAGINDAQSSASQSQYDISTKEAALEKAAAENARLTATVEALETEKEGLTQTLEELGKSVEELKKTVSDLTAQNKLLTQKADFMDAYVVFVENDKTGLYHRYGCAAFAQKSFWAYSRKLAESNGYSPCPVCMP